MPVGVGAELDPFNPLFLFPSEPVFPPTRCLALQFLPFLGGTSPKVNPLSLRGGISLPFSGPRGENREPELEGPLG